MKLIRRFGGLDFLALGITEASDTLSAGVALESDEGSTFAAPNQTVWFVVAAAER